MTDKPKVKFKVECFRKIIHLCVMAIPIGYYYMNEGRVILILAPLTFGFILFDIIKSKIPEFRKWVDSTFGFILRNDERKGAFSGSSYIMFGALFSIIMFPKEIAILVITFTVAGDLAAALAGILIGRHKLVGNATIEGSIAFLSASLIASSFFPGMNPWMRLIGSLFATIIEMLPLKIDDNLTVPILTGTLLTLIMKFIIG